MVYGENNYPWNLLILHYLRHSGNGSEIIELLSDLSIVYYGVYRVNI